MAFRHVVNSAVAPSELSPFSSLCTALLTSPLPFLVLSNISVVTGEEAFPSRSWCAWAGFAA